MNGPPPNWPRVSALLDELIELEPAPLAARLDELECLDPAAATELRDLLARRPRLAAQAFLETLPALTALDGDDGDDRGQAAAALAAGTRVGPYVLEDELGHGGMGTVWRAHAVGAGVRRVVALKLLHPGAYGADLLERFGRERDILATLEHPHIARLYDAGLDATGQPYLALEFVAGEPLDRYCDGRCLDLAARLALMRQVLDAVAFAHSRLVIHRDLKPSNVLVTADGQVRLLDFGIAKLLDDPGTGAPVAAELSQRIITPRYAAPEQISGGPVTTATDVYALGAVLYELVAGCSPYRPARDTRRALEDAILESEPERPSRAIGNAAAGRRGQPLTRLRAQLRGDLDTIVLKALAKDPAGRYATVAALRADLDNYLAGVPVSARRDTPWYRIGKFVRRYRVASTLAAALLVTLVAGSIAIGWQSLRARESARLASAAAARAADEARREKATKNFLVGMFAAVDPRLPSDRPRFQVPAGELLAASADRIEKEFAGDPDTAATLLGLVGDLELAVEDVDRYRTVHARYVALLRNRYGERDERTLSALVAEADFAAEQGDRAAAAALLARTDGLLRSAALDGTRVRAAWWVARANLLRMLDATGAERESALASAIALYERLGVRDESHAQALSSLAGIHYRRDDDDGAVRLYDQAIDVMVAAYGPGYAELGTLYLNRAGPEEESGRFDAALADFERAGTIIDRTVGSRHTDYLRVSADYARLLHRRGQRARADATFEALLRTVPRQDAVRRGGSVAQVAAVIREDYGGCLLAEGRPALALPLLREALGMFRSDSYFSDYQQAFGLRINLARSEVATGAVAAGRARLVAVRDELARAQPPGHPLLLAAREALGRAYLAERRDAAAQAEFERVIADAGGRPSAAHARALADLAAVALGRGDRTEALARSAAAVALARAARQEPDVRLGLEVGAVRARVLAATGDASAAATTSALLRVAREVYAAPAAPLADLESLGKALAVADR